jgi:hypothetical protein
LLGELITAFFLPGHTVEFSPAILLDRPENGAYIISDRPSMRHGIEQSFSDLTTKQQREWIRLSSLLPTPDAEPVGWPGIARHEPGHVPQYDGGSQWEPGRVSFLVFQHGESLDATVNGLGDGVWAQIRSGP